MWEPLRSCGICKTPLSNLQAQLAPIFNSIIIVRLLCRTMGHAVSVCGILAGFLIPHLISPHPQSTLKGSRAENLTCSGWRWGERGCDFCRITHHSLCNMRSGARESIALDPMFSGGGGGMTRCRRVATDVSDRLGVSRWLHENARSRSAFRVDQKGGQCV